MPYTARPDYPTPPDEMCVWRYMDLPKLVDLLSTGRLYFRRLDCFDDPYEGTYPASFNGWLAKPRSGLFALGMSSAGFTPQMTNRDMVRYLSRQFFVNCWHANNHESAAMWSLYAHKGEGVAVKSNVANLKACFNASPREINISEVTYLDFTDPTQPFYNENNTNLLEAALYKRKSFEHEHEARVIFTASETAGSNDPPKGISEPCDLTTLIDTIYLAPFASPLFVNVVKVIVKQFLPGKEVITSDLMKPPHW